MPPAKSAKLEFDANKIYTVSDVAALFNKSVSHIRRKWIKTGKLKYMPDGDIELVLGQWLVDMVLANGAFHGDIPKTNRGKHLISTRRKA